MSWHLVWAIPWALIAFVFFVDLIFRVNRLAYGVAGLVYELLTRKESP